MSARKLRFFIEHKPKYELLFNTTYSIDRFLNFRITKIKKETTSKQLYLILLRPHLHINMHALSSEKDLNNIKLILDRFNLNYIAYNKLFTTVLKAKNYILAYRFIFDGYIKKIKTTTFIRNIINLNNKGFVLSMFEYLEKWHGNETLFRTILNMNGCNNQLLLKRMLSSKNSVNDIINYGYPKIKYTKKIIKFLIANHADVNILFKDASQSNYEVIKLLVKSDVDLSLLTKYHIRMFCTRKCVDIIESVFDSYSIDDEIKREMLSILIEKNNLSILEALLNSKKINFSKYHKDLIMLSIKKNINETFKLLRNVTPKAFNTIFPNIHNFARYHNFTIHTYW